MSSSEPPRQAPPGAMPAALRRRAAHHDPVGAGARRIRIVLAARPGLSAAGLRALLESQGDFTVVAEPGSDGEALRAVQEHQAEVLLIDLSLCGLGAPTLLQAVQRARGSVRTLVLAPAADRELVVEALRLGAWGVVLSESKPELLYRALRGARDGEAWVDRQTVSLYLRRTQEQAANGDLPEGSKFRALLTPRELAIVLEVTEGSTNHDIARKLRLSEQTVKNHLNHVFDKLGVSNRLELAVRALQKGVARPESRA